MIYYLMKCIYCEHPYTYILGDKQRKCSKCKRKFSPKKLLRESLLWDCFYRENTISETCRSTGMHFETVQKYFDNFRKQVAIESDNIYQLNSHRIRDYEEYMYLPKTLRPDEHIEKVKYFLTLVYDKKVYNLMMPSVGRLGLDMSDRDDRKLLKKYLKYSIVSKISTQRSTIRNFWDYFENFILKYKGVSDEQFVYYLKEAEWRFNTSS